MKYLPLLLLLVLCACNGAQYDGSVVLEPVQLCTDPDGFWSGLWHGMILPFSFIWSLFVDDGRIYAVCNNGGWYDFGFVVGVNLVIGSSTTSRRKS